MRIKAAEGRGKKHIEQETAGIEAEGTENRGERNDRRTFG